MISQHGVKLLLASHLLQFLKPSTILMNLAGVCGGGGLPRVYLLAGVCGGGELPSIYLLAGL